MSFHSTEIDPPALMLWHEAGVGQPVVAPGDVDSARHRLERSTGDPAALDRLRLTALALADGTDLSRLDDHQLVDHLAAAVAHGRLRMAGVAPKLLRLVPADAPAPIRASAPARAPRAAPAPVPPAATDATFDTDLDAAAMVMVLQQAALDGVPFCEQCARAAAARAAEETAA
jgi:hypothetical protein